MSVARVDTKSRASALDRVHRNTNEALPPVALCVFRAAGRLPSHLGEAAPSLGPSKAFRTSRSGGFRG